MKVPKVRLPAAKTTVKTAKTAATVGTLAIPLVLVGAGIYMITKTSIVPGVVLIGLGAITGLVAMRV